MVLREFNEYTFYCFVEPVLYIINFILCWGMNMQNNITSDLLSLTHSTLLTADVILVCMK
jgi:hypothetical protein